MCWSLPTHVPRRPCYVFKDGLLFVTKISKYGIFGAEILNCALQGPNKGFRQ